MAKTRPPSPEELVGWKAIAIYLRVSVRTAQDFEKLRGLPIRRGSGVKAPVFALTAELEDWRQKGPVCPPMAELAAWEHNPAVSSPPQQADSAAPTVSTQEPSEAAISRRRVLLPALAGSAILAGAVYGIARLGIKNPPVDWRVAGNTLTVLGDSGRELWHHAFPAQLHVVSYQGGYGQNHCVFSDLDGDGSWETIFIYNPLDPTADRPKVVCFSSRGEIRWEFFTSRDVLDSQSREWTPPYYFLDFAVVHSKSGSARVVITSVHYWSFPNQIAVLDAGGKLVGEFWHRGHLTHISVADLRGDGAPQVLLGGVNDAPDYKQATLLIFDPGSVAGASGSPTGGSYFQGFAPGTQEAEVFFPRTLVNRDQEFNRVNSILIADSRITVTVAEGTSELSTSFVLYDFDFHLNIISVFVSDSIKARYHEMEANGEIQKGSIEGEGERLKQRVKVLRRSV
jgi:hypothetical protein